MAETPWTPDIKRIARKTGFGELCCQVIIEEYEKQRASALPAAGVSEDTALLDWLEEHCVVNARVPLAHGSRDLFWANPRDEDEPPQLRAEIRAARAARRPAPTEER